MARAEKAREMLGWCKAGHDRMMQNPMGADWMLTWGGTIALLRATVYALKKEDPIVNPKIKSVQEAWWKKLCEDRSGIFWDFVQVNRNKLLKDAAITVGQGVTVGVWPGAVVTGRPKPVPEEPALLPRRTVTYEMLGGAYKSRDPRDLVLEAIQWFEGQLDQIERDAV